RAFGVATELEAWHRATNLGVKLLSGYASGDANHDDETLYRFRFDPNYKVGLVLFDHYLPALSRESYRRIGDPERVALAPRGAEGLVETGSVTNAYYLNPQFLFGDPDALLAGVGVVWARSAVPVADPYSTFENGGSPVGPRGAGPASHDLGWELDFGARYRTYVWKDLAMELKGEYGLFFPGAAFENDLGERDDPQSLVRIRFAVLW
ncbi:MAG: hypothetical protein ACNA8W_24050, partial [Bradymonadaceae bacterium]